MLNLNFRHFNSLMEAGRIRTQTARLIINWKRRIWGFFRFGGFFLVFQASSLETRDLERQHFIIRETAFPQTWMLCFSWETLRQSRFLGSQSPGPNEKLLHSLLVRLVFGGRDYFLASIDNTLVIHSKTASHEDKNT